MSKYEYAKHLTFIKARIPHKCSQCGENIEIGNFYFKEKVDMRPPSSLVLKEYCEQCGKER